MGGRYLGTAFNPFMFLLSTILFSLTHWATYRYFKKRVRQSKRRL
jgi:hypothetical protein